MPKMRCLILLGFLYAAVSGPVRASEVINNGNAAVEARLYKMDGSNTTRVINPEQRLSFPDDVGKVKIMPRVALRRDEKVNVKIIHPDGAESIVKNYNDYVIIGQKATLSQASDVGKTTVINTGNVGILLKMHKKTGLPDSRRIYPTQTETLPPDVLRIEMAADGNVWGDEKASAEVYTPDGRKTVLNGFGSKMKLVKETKSHIIPAFIKKDQPPEKNTP